MYKHHGRAALDLLTFFLYFYVHVHFHIHATCSYSMEMQRKDMDMNRKNAVWTFSMETSTWNMGMEHGRAALACRRTCNIDMHDVQAAWKNRMDL
jgi:hypothetical protein